MTTIADRIRHLRETAGLDQAAAARLVGLDEDAWARIEDGTRTPTLGEVAGFAVALGCFTTSILGNPELESRLITTTVSVADMDAISADWHAVADDLRFIMEADFELRAAGYSH